MKRKSLSAKLKAPRVLSGSDAFTLIELIIVILLIAILVALAVPVFMTAEAAAQRGVCWHNQRSLRYALMRWSGEHPGELFVTDSCLPGDGEAYIDFEGNVPGDGGRALAEYFDEATNPFRCPSYEGGEGGYAYITDGTVVACLTDNQIGIKSDGTPFKHDRPLEVGWNHLSSAEADEGKEGEEEEEKEKKTPLGDTFEEISSGMIQLIEDYYAKTGKYPSNNVAKALAELGLNPDDWQLPVDHVLYKPAGSNLKISPEQGYTLTVTGKDGKQRTVKPNSNLVYDTKTDKWYYSSINKKNEVDISTLKVGGG
ncbi:MAG: prepilin-type N-terminal cleavage/methylation domain-containing protein [Actinobacteria bacterium]|jgi:prepilin-type N-terminal cleavage/methylation domain-containing protein|nr:MAG: prepilin-type N-terminal cleavage/methylation domain-containing protein [Actinomycetota bacterium]